MKSFINGMNMAWDDSGSGPAVCLIHGFPLDRRMWRPQVEALAAAGYRVITPDLRGFGESDAPAGDYSMELFSDDLDALFGHLAVERVVVAGMSMGGYILFNLLERHPQRVAAACFAVTRSGADDEAGKKRRQSLAREALDYGAQPVARVFAGMLLAAGTAEERPRLAEEVGAWMGEKSGVGLAGALVAMSGRKDYTPLLHRFRLPALVIGADGDLAIPPEFARALAAGLPQGELCLIRDAGHLANLEQPLEFNHCLLEFLRALPPW
ncbi:MAG TPA: alpha/beta fold hydrolase [Geobacteraceae bacterium]